MSRAKYTTNANDIQPSFIGVDSSGKPAQTVTLPVEADLEFLSALYYGNYEPDIFRLTAEDSNLTHAINAAHEELEASLSEESREHLVKSGCLDAA